MKDKQHPLVSFKTVLSDLLKWLKGHKVVIIGGVAVSLIGRPRLTQDIDAMILLDNAEWDNLLQASFKHGFKPRMSDALKFAQRNRVLLVEHVKSGIGVDISFGALPFEEECIERSKKVVFSDITIPLPTPEDLIIMKAVSHRPKDIIDIEHIADANPRLDMKRIDKWVKEFASVLEMPELWSDLAKILSKRGKA